MDTFQFKYIILGAGPAGLTFANLLLLNGETSFVVIEKEKEAGGLCRSIQIDDAPLDIGGGHFLDVKSQKVNQFLFQFMPENEWNLFERNSKIAIHEMLMDHPIEANIWQLPIDLQIEYLKSISNAGCNREYKKPEKFVDWITWKLGDMLAENYMIPYNKKMFSKNLNELGTYWLEKLPNVSLEDTLRGCLAHKTYALQPGHAQFFYPKEFGYGELWRRMAEKIKSHIIYEKVVQKIDFDAKTIACGGDTFFGEKIIMTIPWKEFKTIDNMPSGLKSSLQELKNNSIYVNYIPKKMETDAHWIYYPDQKLSYHRILVRHNFCPGSKGYWTETNAERALESAGKYSFYNEYAYPLNTIGKPEIMEQLIDWANTKNVYPLGRWGEHQHYNSDVTVLRAMELYEKIQNEEK